VPSEIISFRPFVSDTVHEYSSLRRKVERAGSMAWCHKKPHKELDPLVPNVVVNFLYILMLTQPQPIISYHRSMHFRALL